MISTRIPQRLLQLAIGLSLVSASALGAQDRALLVWSGRVDKEVQLTLRDSTVTSSIVGGAPVVTKYLDIKDRVPRRAGFVRVELDAGRGDVDVIQQPTAANDFAAVIRIRDASVGVDTYQLKAFWNPKNGEDRWSPAANTVRANAATLPANTMHWIGSVDREANIEWRGMDVRTRTLNGAESREVHSDVSNGLPMSAARVELSVREGRGDITITQQPTSANGYTVIFRVRDPQTGFGHYTFDATWR